MHITSLKKLFYFLFLAVFLLGTACSSDDGTTEQDKPQKDDPKEEEPKDYQPGNPDDIEKDIQIDPDSAEDNQHQNGEGIQNTLDDDQETLYHSPYGDATEFPVTLEYFFDEVETIDYIVLYPRKDQANGRFGKVTLYTKTEGEGDYQKFKEYDFDESGSPKTIEFPDGLDNPKTVKISVESGANDFASLAEIEFYKNNPELNEYLEVFNDKAATELKSGITKEDIEDIDNEFIRKMALSIYQDTYNDFRIGEFKSYPDPNVVASKNKTSTYGVLDNATGIYVKWGTEMVVFMGDFEGDISLRVLNHKQGYGESKDFLLKPGVNRFTVNEEGLAYLIYQDDQDHKVKVNFATGKINGYFDIEKNTNADWDELLDNATYSYFDVLGEKAMLSFTTDDFRANTDDIERLIGLYDELVEMEDDFLGLYKYGGVPQTRMYYRTNVDDPDMYMYSTAYRTEYNVGTMDQLTNADNLESNPWGPAHETGHTHQTRPGIMWLGLTEVTTNIYAQYIQTQWGNDARLDAEDMGDYTNRYEKGFSQSLDHEAHPAIEDVFVKLIPFWQLQLYFNKVVGYHDFYKDVHEYMRTHDDPSTPGKQQLNFVRVCSKIAELDLSDFFKSWGYLTPGKWNIDDYGEGTLTVTQNMVDDLISEVSQYSKPSDDFKYINENNIDIYKNGGAVSGGTASISGKEVQVRESTNAVAYQQEREGDVIFVGVRDSFTLDNYKEGDKIYAVGYDGNRKEIKIN